MKKTLIAVPIVIVLLAVAGAVYQAVQQAKINEKKAEGIRAMHNYRGPVQVFPVGHPRHPYHFPSKP